MFHITHRLPVTDSGFFLTKETGYFKQVPSTQFYRVTFDVDAYDDQLFDQFDIDLPIKLSTAIIKRKAEYLAGRYCAKTLLDKRHFEDFDLQSGAGRAPCWPESIVGSISHVNDTAMAVVDSNTNLHTLGIDVEKLITPSIINTTSATILTKDEISLLKQCELDFSHAFTVTFSMKESLYKALYPQVNKFFDFHSAEIISISEELQQITLKLTKTLSEHYREGHLFIGHYSIESNSVTTLILH
ncbi:MAG: 4'-phosphopantetheinyl transferase superfamily protein [Aliivibrio sp.]|uniref:4'-phosphopantetheinyl transferase family protein n=1 Tax=Aliivibrio sp. TaxID=1872443 RepID=UPI001A42BF8E|nr:4'-phosphopantetheinyl transferase superfamily protein [Aliivibrio sp.]